MIYIYTSTPFRCDLSVRVHVAGRFKGMRVETSWCSLAMPEQGSVRWQQRQRRMRPDWRVGGRADAGGGDDGRVGGHDAGGRIDGGAQ